MFALLLSVTVKHHLSLCPQSFVVRELGENLRVDDLLSGADSESEALELFSELGCLGYRF